MKITNENYFDIAEALHTVLSLWHRSKWDISYATLCKSQFKPGIGWKESIVEIENEFFPELELLAKAGEYEALDKLMEELNLFLERIKEI